MRQDIAELTNQVSKLYDLSVNLKDDIRVLKEDISKLKERGSSLSYLIRAVGVIACFALAIHLVRPNHLFGVDNPVKVVG